MPTPLKITLLLLVLGLSASRQDGLRAQSQEPLRFEHLTVSDGLATNAVNTIVQDTQGFLWFGTDSGLHRYDGYQFTIYRHDSNDPFSLSTDEVTAIHEDRAGVLWIGTSGGLHRFDRATERFTPYRHNPDVPGSLSNNVVWVIDEDRAGALWVGTGEGLNRFDRATERFIHFGHDPNDPYSLSGNRVSVIHEDRDGGLWIGTVGSGHLDRFDAEAERFLRYPIQDVHQEIHHPDRTPSFSGNAVHAIHEDRSGVLWIGTWREGLYRIDSKAETITRYRHDPDDPNSLGSDYVTTIEEDEDGVLWIGSVVGLAPWGSHALTRFDPSTNTFTRIPYDPMNPEGFQGRWVRAIYRDRAGTLWIAVSDYGIHKLDPLTGTFTAFPYDTHSENNFTADGVRALYEDHTGVLWIGTDEGLERLDRATGSKTLYQHHPEDPGSLSHTEIKCLLEDREGVLWVGTWGGGLNRFDPATETFTPYRHDPDDPTSLSSDLVDSIYQDRDGVLWVGTWSGPTGLNRLNRETDTFTRYLHDPQDATSLHSRFVSAFYEDSRGMLWMGGDGLVKFDRASGQFTQVLQDELIYTIHEDQAGRLWVGGDTGFYLFDRETGAAESFTGKHGLPNIGALGIIGDEAGNLWLSRQGLIRFNPETFSVRLYGRVDGLPSLDFNRTAYFKSPSGEIFFGSRGGAVAFYPERVMENPYVPPIVLTDFKLFNTSVPVGEDGPLNAHLSMVESIALTYDQNDVTFEFAALNYRHAEKNRYAYMLEGYDDFWREVGTQRTATYANLSPGDYVFRVKGANDDGIWNHNGASIRVVITPPFWVRWWFYTICAAVALALAGGSYRLRVRHLKQRQRELAREVQARTQDLALEKQKTEAQAQQLQEMDRVKSRFFANISHEFRTPLTLILGPLHDALDGAHGPLGTKHLRMMRRSGLRLQRLINQLLDLSKLEAGRMHLQARRQNLPPFLRGLVQSFASLAARRLITLQFRVEQEALYLYFDADKLEQIISNLLSNAFKCTPSEGQIQVIVGAPLSPTGSSPLSGDADAWVEIRICDTGPGIPAGQLPYIFDRFHQINGEATHTREGTGIGLALAKELVERHGGTIRAESTPGQGATFIVRLPMGKGHLAPEDLVEDEGREAPAGEATPAFSRGTDEEAGSLEPLPADPPPDAPTVLIVEDDPDVRAYLKGHLRTLYHVAEAVDGVEGLEQARALGPDLVISDVMMPRLNGYALCKAMKTDETLSHIPVVLLTARADEESRAEGLETGADDYLCKPFNAAELLLRVENLIEIRRILRRRFSGEVMLQPGEISIPSAEALFIKQVRAVVEAQMADRTFTVERLAHEVALSPRQLQRKLRALTRLSPRGFIRSMRLARAAQLLEQRAGNVSEVALAVGFQDEKYFSKLFRQTFGVSPSAYGPSMVDEADSSLPVLRAGRRR